MTTPPMDPDGRVIPARTIRKVDDDGPVPEATIFDKAEEVESIEKLRSRLSKITEELAEADNRRKAASDDVEPIQREIERLTAEGKAVESEIAKREESLTEAPEKG